MQPEEGEELSAMHASILFVCKRKVKFGKLFGNYIEYNYGNLPEQPQNFIVTRRAGLAIASRQALEEPADQRQTQNLRVGNQPSECYWSHENIQKIEPVQQQHQG